MEFYVSSGQRMSRDSSKMQHNCIGALIGCRNISGSSPKRSRHVIDPFHCPFMVTQNVSGTV